MDCKHKFANYTSEFSILSSFTAEFLIEDTRDGNVFDRTGVEQYEWSCKTTVFFISEKLVTSDKQTLVWIWNFANDFECCPVFSMFFNNSSCKLGIAVFFNILLPSYRFS